MTSDFLIRPVVGHEDFLVTSGGQVFSKTRYIDTVRLGKHVKRLVKGRWFKVANVPGRYSLVGLAQRTSAVHRLVAEAFIPNPDNKPEINHKTSDIQQLICKGDHDNVHNSNNNLTSSWVW